MGFKETLERIFGRQIHPPGVPYMPSPPEAQSHATSPAHQAPGNPTSLPSVYTEMQAELQPINGTDIKFGTEKIILVDTNGHAQDLTRNHNHVLGSGKLVTRIEDVAGVCRICLGIAVEQCEAGKITPEQAQLTSLYDTASAATCSVCGFQGCIRHIRPVQTDEGQLHMCVPCQKEFKKQLLRQRVIQLLLGPISEIEDEQE